MWWIAKHPADITGQLSQRKTVILVTEIIFISAFVLWALMRSYSPLITATEKPMEFAFLNSILRSEYMPPPDPWLSGFPLNNYYFGHFIVSVLCKLTGVSSGIAFNLAIALFFALTATGIFSLVYNLVARSERIINQKKAIAFGLIGILLLLLVSNLEGILEFFYSRGMGSREFWDWLAIEGLNQPYTSREWYPTEYWWWWRASRIIATVSGGNILDYTITEFPFFSFLLADLHGHLLALPFVLLALSFSLNIMFSKEFIGIAWAKRNPVILLITMIGLGSLGVIHTWDFPVYVGIFLVALFIQSYLTRSELNNKWWKEPGLLSCVVLIGVFFYYLPFYLAFQRPVTGVLPWLGPGTRPLYWVILYGLFIFAIAPMILMESRILTRINLEKFKRLAMVIPVIFTPLLIWTLIKTIMTLATSKQAVFSPVLDRWINLLPVILLFLLLTWLCLFLIKKTRDENPEGLPMLAVLLLIAAATLTIYGTELFYVRDVLFNNRMNTIFRFHYQVWVFLAVAASYGLYYVSTKAPLHRFNGNIVFPVWWAAMIFITAGSLFYPAAAPLNRITQKTSPTLDGQAYLQPAQREYIQWIKNNVPSNSVIVEAFGKDYSEAGRVAQWTGVPTILAWPEHEKIWRGTDRDFQGRAQDIERIYRSTNVEEIKSTSLKYGAEFIFFGNLELQAYGTQPPARFASIADVVFKNEAATIYRIRN